MRISEVAKRTGLNVSSIRFYERKGLLAPVRAEESKYRDYTEEDVQRIKRILLYRKMGISVETIWLLLNGQADMNEVLQRNISDLQSQMENLQGALELSKMLLEERQIDDGKLDQYLNYVHEEEARGRKFAEAEELLEDLVEFTRTNIFSWHPGLIWLFQRPWIARLISVGLWIAVMAVPVIHLADYFRGAESLKPVLLIVYGCLMVIYGCAFMTFRKEKKKYLEGGREK